MGHSLDAADSPSTRPLSRVTLGLLGLAAWGVVVLGTGSQTYATYALKGEKTSWSDTVLWAFNDWSGWLLLAPLVFWVARRFPIERPHLSSRLGLHATVALVVSAVHGVLYFLLEWATGSLWHEMTPRQLVLVYVTKSAASGVLIYLALVAVSHGINYYRRYQERERRATQLLAQLSRAELEVLKMQLQPHFLFNTLHAISALVRPDPDAAERIITRLGDLLRMSLASNGTQEVPLAQELEFVEKYADIQRTRFRDRLSIRIEAEPGIERAVVPSLILQPLVENSIRHGVERREQSAAIVVRARRVGDRMVLSVADDGPGFPEEVLTPVPGRGLGLANTRARIAALYGDAGRLEISAVPGGGALVTLDFPFRESAHAAA
jgi:signal transduction histidine kinase